jgi:coenzyme F420-reducing hydrogenase gamma subunit
MDNRIVEIIANARLLSNQMPHTERAFVATEAPLTGLEKKALGGAGNCIDDLLNVVESLHDILEKHRRFHSKVACPEKPDCDVCLAEELLLLYGPMWYAAHVQK